MDKIKIIVVDDHEMIRCGIRYAIENRHPDIIIVGEAKSGAEFFSLNSLETADLTLLDIALPDINGIKIAQQIKKQYPNMKILAFSATENENDIKEMINTGVDGFISKENATTDILTEAIRSIMHGFNYFGKDISDIISRIYVAKKKSTNVTSEFSEQEKKVIELCIEGLSAKMIADRINISTRTVDWHKSNIFRKLGINSTIEMVNYCLKNGII
ncbi:MAG: response regulator transcription factor [Marinilabiliaceae bacterium]|nr:response regulator transcription factor [Marinilabiliaceae bacterium]